MKPARRVRARVEGTVQGVGFRPFVYRLADELGLDGHVRNDERGVLLEVQGPSESVERFLGLLAAEPPPLALVEGVALEDLAPTPETGFRILDSQRVGEPAAPVSADTATCDDCLAELFDPRDHRHRYPFINCTNCGPRFTIVRGVPYDRPLTTMAGFRMCRRCQGEYDDPANRRFHAQPNACADCGPSARLLDAAGHDAVGPGDGVAGAGDAIAAAAAALRGGRILAVKGIGGFHLACRADDERAVATLRARKHREEKPFAVMAPDLAIAAAMAHLTPEQQPLVLGR